MSPFNLAARAALACTVVFTLTHLSHAAVTFRHSFNGPSFDAEFALGNDSPVTNSGPVTFAAGQFNQGVLIDNGDVLTYSAVDNINPTEATISFFFKPNFDSTDAGVDAVRLIDVRDSSGGSGARQVDLHYQYDGTGDGGGNTGRFRWFHSSEGTLNSQWLLFSAGDVLEIGVTWNGSQRRISVNGVEMSAGGFNSSFPNIDEIWIGMFHDGTLQAEGVIDNLNITDTYLDYDFTAIPEPGSVSMLIGLVLASVSCRRRRSSPA